MVTISVRFVRGTYHATPWGRHPNEGAVEWPPSPWRIARGIVSAYFRLTGLSAVLDEDPVVSLAEKLASTPPVYYLPPTSPTHTRHYHPGATYQLLDSFLVVDRDERLVVQWRDVELSSEEADLLDRLLPAMPYLGRSESWAEVRRDQQWTGPINCRPILDHRTDGETVLVQIALTPDQFSAWRQGFLEASATTRGKSGIELAPQTLWDAITITTQQLEKERWSRAPGTRDVAYVVERTPSPPRRNSSSGAMETQVMARFSLIGRPLPTVRNAVLVGDAFRRAFMQTYAEQSNGLLPDALTGHTGEAPARGHHHGYFLPEDADGDGWIDHVLVYFPTGITRSLLRAMGSLKRLHALGFSWTVTLEGVGQADHFSGVSTLVGPARRWRSVTPYLHPWHQKKNGKFGTAEQLAREIGLLGRFSEIEEVQRIDGVALGGRKVMPLEFRRWRHNSGGPDRQGSFWSLVFNKPVNGPLALGTESHYGLGLFVPDQRD